MLCVLLASWESLVPLSPFMLFFLNLKALFLSHQGAENQELSIMGNHMVFGLGNRTKLWPSTLACGILE